MERVKYASDYLEEIQETNWNPATQIGLIPFCCGIGKTTAARKGCITDFVARITNQEISKNETLLLTFRTLAKQQQLRQGGFVDIHRQSAFGDFVYIGTAQALGNALCNPESSKNQFPSYWLSAHPRILILDEIHCLMEGDFAPNLNGALEYIEDCAQDPNCAVIALDATTDFLTNYLFGNRSNVEIYNIVDEAIEPSYAPKKINVINHTSLGTSLDLKADKINSSCKAFVVCHSAEKAYQLYRKRNELYQDASFLCSPSSKSLIKVAKDEEKEARLLLDQDCLESIVNNAAFPQGVNVVFATIAAREAIELKDESIKYVALDLYDEIGIIQTMNRVRHSIDMLDIIVDGRGIMLGLEEYEKSLEDLNSLPINPSQEDLKEYYHDWLNLLNRCNANEIKQEEVISPIVYKENNTYKINRLSLAGAEYRTKAANQAFNTNREEFQDYYLWILRMYDKQTIEFIDGRNLRNELSNRNINVRAANEIDLVKLEQFLEMEIPFSDKKTIERLKKILGLKSKMFKLRPLSFYMKGEGKQILFSLGLEMKKYQKNRKTHYMICKKV